MVTESWHMNVGRKATLSVLSLSEVCQVAALLSTGHLLIGWDLLLIIIIVATVIIVVVH